MAKQLDMFAAPVAVEPPRTSGPATVDPGRSAAPPALAPCPYHSSLDICPECPERPSASAAGFPHRQDAQGRRPLRRCAQCKRLVPLGAWNVADWFHCLGCVPLGLMSELGAARSPRPTDPKKIIRGH